ncbi:tetratricopeptide repeat protein [Hyalangium gracile]|uniref:tetratricopeptide repeat protein n=1 Tax=Hyalangium gracile TaxID=394092 RepID=UPI001CC9AF8E|nr:tetratricopeptide repeat protein [Hyalangium gracile]
MKLRPGLWLLVALLLVSGAAWAQTTGIEHYEYGDFEAAARLFEQELATSHLPPARRALTRMYLAASLYALGQVEEARKPLEALAREHPEERVDPVRFPPELVVLAELIRQQVESEQRQLAAREAELQQAREEERRRAAKAASIELRPEVLGLIEALDRQWTVGAGFAFRRKSLEGSVRVMLGDPPVFQLQGGVLPGQGDFRPFLGLRASLLPGIDTYGAGPVVGGRIALPAGLVGVVDFGADYFFTRPNSRYRFAVTAQAGLGFSLPVP